MFRPLLLVVLAACAPEAATLSPLTAPGQAAPPLVAPPSLSVPTVVHGDRVTITVTSTSIGAGVMLFQGGRVGAGPCSGVCLDILNPALVGRGTMGADGRAQIVVNVPARAANSTSVFQAVVYGGGRARKTSTVKRHVSDSLALMGSWVDDYGYGHDIDNHVWFDFGSYEVERFSNRERWVVAHNGPDTFGAGLWSRFDWTTDASGFTWYCQTAYNAATLTDALNTARADDTDPTTAGCGGAYPGGFAWTRLQVADLAVTGQWTDDYGDAYVIDEHAWVSDYGTWNITQWYAARNFLVAQNDATNSFFPGLWSRFDWTTDGTGALWYCQSAYAEAREADAVEVTEADPTDPANGGCGGAYPGGFAWTRLAP
jgi:hypothetical protein